MIAIRRATLSDTPAIVALNDAVVAVTSPMDSARFHALYELAAFCDVIERKGNVVGFILAMQHGAAYANGNFGWFSDRLNRFVYVDRIVIGAAARGLGLGRMAYDHLAQSALARDCLMIAAEIDLVPPNPGSMEFHRKYGFVQIGQRPLDSGKIVSMQIKGLV